MKTVRMHHKFSALFPAVLDPMNIKSSVRALVLYMLLSCFISKPWSLSSHYKKTPPGIKLKGWEAGIYPVSTFVLRYPRPFCKPAKFRPHPFTSTHLSEIAYISHTHKPANFLQISSMQIPFKHIHPLSATNDNAGV